METTSFRSPCLSLAAGAFACAAAWPVHAGGGQIDAFDASTTTVTAGSTVDFSLSYSVFADATQQWGGSNPIEPAPEEGYQTWDINWYSVSTESITSVGLSAGGQSWNDTFAPDPGASHSGGWNFSLTFDTPGTYEIAADGSWESSVDSYYSSESASRNCWYNDPDARDFLTCDSWTYQYGDQYDNYSNSGVLGGRSLTITVTAVPEPATLALWGAGLALLAARRRPASRR